MRANSEVRGRMFTTRPTLQGTFGMVSSTHWLASQSAMAVLEDGGNAFDAAVAGAFVLHVVEPHLNGPAGEVPILLAPAGGAVRVLCGQGVAPAGATVAHYRGLGLDLVPGTGPLAAAVPGAFDAWLLLLRDHGTKSLDDVLKYAIGYAEHGHAPVENVGLTVESVRRLFETEWTSSAELYLPGGRAPRPGTLLRNPALAATWKRLLAETAGAGGREARIDAAREVWRSGFIAEALVRQSRRPTLDTSGERHTGTLTEADLAGWSATYETPVTYDWNGWTVCKAGPWSQGPVLLQQLALLPPELPAYGSADYVHLLIEGCKLAMADREAWYGDAAEVPLADLLSDEYNAARRALVGDDADHGLRPGSPGGRTPRLPARAHARVRQRKPVGACRAVPHRQEAADTEVPSVDGADPRPRRPGDRAFRPGRHSSAHSGGGEDGGETLVQGLLPRDSGAGTVGDAAGAEELDRFTAARSLVQRAVYAILDGEQSTTDASLHALCPAVRSDGLIVVPDELQRAGAPLQVPGLGGQRPACAPVRVAGHPAEEG